MIVGVPKEIYPGERRVAVVPAVVPNLKKAGLEVVIEAGAGAAAGYPDREYADKGARLTENRGEVFQTADILAQFLVHGANDKTGQADLPLMRKGQLLVGFLRPLGNVKTLQEIAERGVSAFSVELMPRTTRAQSMDALSSMATICGPRAGAARLRRGGGFHFQKSLRADCVRTSVGAFCCFGDYLFHHRQADRRFVLLLFGERFRRRL